MHVQTKITWSANPQAFMAFMQLTLAGACMVLQDSNTELQKTSAEGINARNAANGE
jgi:hypothetical protein